MHNTTNKMKKSQLRKLVQEAIQEILNEDAAADKTAQQAKISAIDKEIQALQKTKAELSKETSPLAEYFIDEMASIFEDELNEMAWGIKDNKLKYYKKTSLEKEVELPQRLTPKQQEIINFLKQKEGEIVSDKEIQNALELGRPQMVNGQLSNIMAQAPALPSSMPSGEPEEEEPEEEEGYEDIVAGDLSDEEIEASFAKAKRAGEEEPETGEIETTNVATGRMSDEDYEAFMQYSDLKNRLANVKSDILKAKRSRGTAGDISDRPSNEVERLRDLKDRLQKKINDLVASSEYLKKSQAKATSKSIEEPEADEEEQLDEWIIGRMQFYAGIKK